MTVWIDFNAAGHGASLHPAELGAGVVIAKDFAGLLARQRLMVHQDAPYASPRSTGLIRGAWACTLGPAFQVYTSVGRGGTSARVGRKAPCVA